MTLIAILFTLSGVMLAALGVPMLLGRVPPNSLYGFRTPATVGEPALWYPANRYAGRRMIEAGLVLALASAALAFLGLSVDGYTLAGTGVLINALSVVIIRSLCFLKHLQASRNVDHTA